MVHKNQTRKDNSNSLRNKRIVSLKRNSEVIEDVYNDYACI